MTNKVSYSFVAQDLYSKAAAKISKATSNLKIKMAQLRDASVKAFNDTRKAVNKSARNIAKRAADTIKLAGAVGSALTVKFGAEFQDAMADLSAITGATGKDLDKLKEKSLAMATASVTSQAEVAEAIKLVASAKPDLLDNIDALTATTEQVLLLKNAAGIELASAANITAQGLNIFGESASKAGEFVNILAAGAKFGSSEIKETGEAMLIAGPGAKAAGLSFLQLNAAIQTVAKGGIKGAQAGTALNAIFGRLRRAGLDIKKLGLEKTFTKVKARLDKVKNSTKRAQLEAKIFGEEHSKVGLALLQNASLLGEMERKLKGTNSAQEQANKRMATFSTKMRKLGVLIKGIMIRLFLKLEPVLSKVVERASDFVSKITDKDIDVAISKFKTFAKVMIGIGIAIKNTFVAVGTFIGETIAKITLAIDEIRKMLEWMGVLEKKQQAIQVTPPPWVAAPGGPAPGGTLPIGTAPLDVSGNTQTDVNINLHAPEGAVESVKTKTTKGRKNMNVGVNMVTK